MEYFQFFILSNSSQMINPIQNLKVVISKNFSVQMPLQSFYSTQLSNLDPRILQSFENNQCLSFISLLNREFPLNYQISIRLEVEIVSLCKETIKFDVNVQSASC